MEVKKMNGYAGKILKLNLRNRKTTTISTRKYEKWVGGHGMGSAIEQKYRELASNQSLLAGLHVVILVEDFHPC
jgi:aldehyde:ferredoxin oxidoreductase